MKNYLLIIFSQINERQMTSYGVAFNKNIWTQTSVLQHQRSALNSPDFLISHSFDGDVPFNFSITVITSIPSRNSPRITFSYQSPMRCRANATSYHERFSARLVSWKEARFHPDFFHIFCEITSKVVAIMFVSENAVLRVSSITMTWNSPPISKREKH